MMRGAFTCEKNIFLIYLPEALMFPTKVKIRSNIYKSPALESIKSLFRNAINFIDSWMFNLLLPVKSIKTSSSDPVARFARIQTASFRQYAHRSEDVAVSQVKT